VNSGLATAKCLYSQNVLGHRGCVNAVNFSNAGEELLVSGGDDEKVLLWRVSEMMRGKHQPVAMDTTHSSNIFTATFSCDNTYIYSGGNDANLIKHDAATGKQVSVHRHSEAVYSISPHPLSPSMIVTASEDGIVRTIDSRLPHFTDDMSLVVDCNAFQCVTFNPIEPCLVATGNTRLGSALYDTRTRKKVFSYSSSKHRVFGEDVVSLSFSQDGKFLFAMQRRLPPCLYRTTQPNAAAVFMDEKGEYMNMVSMKSGCFVGINDEYVASGSDDFRVYLWKIPEDLETLQSCPIDRGVVPSPHLVLPGHRSIANQIRYSPTHHLLCSSGVEKIIKLWSHMPLSPAATLEYSGGPPSRKRYTRQEFLQLTMSEDSDDNGMASEQEDRSVLAFFDALVNEEERGFSSLCDSSSDDSDAPSSLLMDPDSDDSFTDISFPFGDGPVDFMRYPYPDEEPGRATWDFMTPQERWDWHHGRREWYYADGEDASTPSDVGNSSSYEATWSDDSDIEREDDGGDTAREGASHDFSVGEDEVRARGGDEKPRKGAVTGNGECSSSQAHPSNGETERETQKDGDGRPQNSGSCESAQPGECKCCREKFRITIGEGESRRKSKHTSEREPPFRILYIGGGSHEKKTTDNDFQQPSTSKETQAANGSASDVVTTSPIQTKKECGNEQQGDGCAVDLPKAIPPVQFYSSRQTSSAAVPPHTSTQSPLAVSSNGVKKRLCSQGLENVPSTSSGCEAEPMQTETQQAEGAAHFNSGCHYTTSATTKKGQKSSRKGKRQ
jgi:hypothetical protein